MELQPHQRDTVQFIETKCTNQHGLLVFHNMGTGKTTTSVGWLINRQKLYKKGTDTHTSSSSLSHKAHHAHKAPESSSSSSSKKKRHKSPHTSSSSSSSKKKRHNSPHTSSSSSSSKKKRHNSSSSSTHKSSSHTHPSADRSTRSHHNRAGSHPPEDVHDNDDDDSSAELESSSDSATAQSHRSRKRVHPSKREFDYLIVCPETVKGAWDKEAQKMGFDIDNTKILNYRDVLGLVQSKQLDVSGKNVIFDEAHHLCKIMKSEKMENYMYVLKRLNKADKLLLLTGTPEHGGKADFMILVNLIAKQNKFPVHTQELYKKYRNRDIFEKRKNSIFFNWIQPVAWTGFNMLYALITGIIAREIGNYTKTFLYDRFLYNKTRAFLKGAIGDGGDAAAAADGDEYDDYDVDVDVDEYDSGGDTSHSRGGDVFDAGHSFLKSTTATILNKVSKSFAKIPTTSTQLSALAVKVAGREVANVKKSASDDILWGVSNVDRLIQGTPTQMVMWALQKYVMASFQFLQVEQNPQYALQMAPLDLERMSNDIGRYVSYYQQDTTSVDFGSTQIEKPTEALFTLYQSNQCLFFIYGTMDHDMVRFYADVDIDGAALKIEEFRTIYGVRTYGRCISNMWKIIDHIPNKMTKFVFDATDGTVRMELNPKKNVDRLDRKARAEYEAYKAVVIADLKKMSGCPKFENIVTMLRAAEKKGERTLIRSDFKSQGIYLLSTYLNHLNIKHYYIRTTMPKEERARILDEYNNVYRPVLVDGKKGHLLEYATDDAPLDSIQQIFVGITVHSLETNAQWKHGRVQGVDTENATVSIMDDDTGDLFENVPFKSIYRVYTISYEKNNKRAQVRSTQLELRPYDSPPAPIILLDKDSSEGISLMGVEHVHLLEPLESVAERDQSLARAIRFQSHRHLPKSRHIVHVYTHIGVVKPTVAGMDSVKAILQGKIFEHERNAHINKQFAGVVPRAAKGSAKDNPIGYLFDHFWNGIDVLHHGFDGTTNTPDTMVLANVTAEETHIGAYTRFIRKTNVLGKNFELPSDCIQDETNKLKTTGFTPIHAPYT